MRIEGKKHKDQLQILFQEIFPNSFQMGNPFFLLRTNIFFFICHLGKIREENGRFELQHDKHKFCYLNTNPSENVFFPIEMFKL